MKIPENIRPSLVFKKTLLCQQTSKSVWFFKKLFLPKLYVAEKNTKNKENEMNPTFSFTFLFMGCQEGF